MQCNIFYCKSCDKIFLQERKFADFFLSIQLKPYDNQILNCWTRFHFVILTLQGNQILSNLSSEEYSRVVKVLEDAILSTDLAVYFRWVSAACVSLKSAFVLSEMCAQETRLVLQRCARTRPELGARRPARTAARYDNDRVWLGSHHQALGCGEKSEFIWW
jgi:hypothetical protein